MSNNMGKPNLEVFSETLLNEAKKNSNILEIKNELLNFTQQNLTTEILAKYVLNKQKL